MGCGRADSPCLVELGSKGFSWLYSDQTMLRLVEEDHKVVDLRLVHPERDGFGIGGEGDVSWFLGPSVLIPIGLGIRFQNTSFAVCTILDEDRYRVRLDAGEQVCGRFSEGAPGIERDEGNDRDRGIPSSFGIGPRAARAGLLELALRHGC
jgi:hypothetical protein